MPQHDPVTQPCPRHQLVRCDRLVIGGDVCGREPAQSPCRGAGGITVHTPAAGDRVVDQSSQPVRARQELWPRGHLAGSHHIGRLSGQAARPFTAQALPFGRQNPVETVTQVPQELR